MKKTTPLDQVRSIEASELNHSKSKKIDTESSILEELKAFASRSVQALKKLKYGVGQQRLFSFQ